MIPHDLIPKILAFSADVKTVVSLRKTSKFFRAISLGELSHTRALLQEYIKRHPNLTVYQLSHLNSDATARSLAMQIDSIENLLRQCDRDRIEQILLSSWELRDLLIIARITNPQAQVEPSMLPVEYVQDILDWLNLWRIDRSKESLALTPDYGSQEVRHSTLFDETLRMSGAAMGLKADQMSDTFSYLLLEAVCKGHDYNKISHLSEPEVKALILTETLEEFNNPARTSLHACFMKLGISLRETLTLNHPTLTLIDIYLGAKLANSSTGFKYKFPDQNLLECFKSAKLRISACTNFAKISDKEKFAIIAGVPEDTYTHASISIYHACMHIRGMEIKQVLAFNKSEARAISLGVSPYHAVKFPWHGIALDLLANERESDASINLDERLKKYLPPNNTTGLQNFIALYYSVKPEEISHYAVDECHVSMIVWSDSIGQKMPPIVELLQQSGLEVAGKILGLGTEQIDHPCFSHIHVTVILYNLTERKTSLARVNFANFRNAIKLEYAKFRDIYSSIIRFNAIQVAGLLSHPLMTEEFIACNLLCKDFYTALELSPYAIDELQKLRSFQLSVLHIARLDQVAEPWFAPEHAFTLNLFGAFFEFDDLNPENIQMLAKKHNLPEALLTYSKLSWAHVLAYVRFVPITHILQLNTIQALAMACGLTLSQAKNPLMSIYHLILIKTRDDDMTSYPYEMIKHLDSLQVLGLSHGLYVQDVESDWYTPYHLCAAMLGYNRIAIQGATASDIMALVQSCYKTKIDIDAFIDLHINPAMLGMMPVLRETDGKTVRSWPGPMP